MPWIDVAEPYARPPKLPPDREVTAEASVVAEGVWAEVAGGRVVAGSLDAVADAAELSLTDAHVVGGRLPAAAEVELRQSMLTDVDLSQLRLGSVRATRFTGCKLVGSDLSGTSVVDTVFTNCSLSLTNLRMATLERVAFVDCALSEVDCYELTATDVTFDGCTLDAVNLDGLRATRVDLRGATDLSLAAARSLGGCLVAEHQLPALAFSLALAVGLDIESPESNA